MCCWHTAPWVYLLVGPRVNHVILTVMQTALLRVKLRKQPRLVTHPVSCHPLWATVEFVESEMGIAQQSDSRWHPHFCRCSKVCRQASLTFTSFQNVFSILSSLASGSRFSPAALVQAALSEGRCWVLESLQTGWVSGKKAPGLGECHWSGESVGPTPPVPRYLC